MTEITIEVFKFSGQSKLDTWKLRNAFKAAGWAAYSDWLVDELPFCLQKIRDLADSFSFWQRIAKRGRKAYAERDLLIGYLLKEFFQATFRQTEALMTLFQSYFHFKAVPDHTTLSRKNRTKRWIELWKRLHKFILNLLPQRQAIVATDATGYSGRKKPWREWKYEVRANQDWVKLHAAIETETFLILGYELTESEVHDSQPFGDVWEDIPDNIQPIRSLADSAYSNNKCAQIARDHEATPYHSIKKNAVCRYKPQTAYEKMVNYAKHWPNRFAKEIGKRNHAETVFSSIGARFGYRIKCRSKIGRKNEVQSKINSHNIRMIAQMAYTAQY